MRSDFLDRVAEDPLFVEELSRSLVFLASPDRAGLREALVAPVEMVGYRFETDAMVDDMLAALAGTPAALPLLQFTAAKLWEARDPGHRMLTVASYQRLGGVSGALATHADDVLNQMNASLQRLTRTIFQRLVTPERTRAIVELADLHQLAPDHAEVARAIDLLVAARLLMVQTRTDVGGDSVELVHESLIDRWPTLRRWLDEDHEDAAFLAQLSTAAKQWEAMGRPTGLLWRGDAMEVARRWYVQRPRGLPARDAAFLHSVFALARRGKRARRIALVTAFALLGTIAAGASVAAVWIRGAEQAASESLAKMQEKEAQRLDAERRKAAAEQLKAQAEQLKAQAEQQQLAAEAEKARAQQTVAEQSAVIEGNREQLADRAVRLEAALREAGLARDHAERERTRTQQVADDLAKANAVLKKRNDELEQEKKKMVTKLQ
jgi:eukaryotic-like serine/threonine-protein kinase